MEALTIENLNAKNRQIYVKNNKGGILSITLYDQNGRHNRVILPKTKHPLCLTSHASPWAIANSSELRKCFRAKAITLLDPDEAEKILENEQVMLELETAYERISLGSEEVQQHKSTKSDEDGDLKSIISESIEGIPKMEHIDPRAEIEFVTENVEDEDDIDHIASGDINPRVIALATMLATKEGVSVKEAKVELSNMIEELTNDDLDYLAHNTQGAIQDWAKNVLSVRLGSKTIA